MALKTVIVIILAFIVNVASSQNWTVISEEQVPVKVIAKHYGANEGLNTTMWSLQEEAGENYYLADFQLDGTSRKIKYNLNGKPICEALILKDAPADLIAYLDQQYLKPKVVEFREINNLITKEKIFQVVLKTKNLGEFMLEFDNQLTPLGVEQGFAAF